jgi:CO/xanthine dehydrogenase Mo-binding subunit
MKGTASQPEEYGFHVLGIAPAVGNAIFDAIQIRLCSMPMAPDGLKV